MEKRMIRCVSIKPDKKTGEYAVKFLSENVVNNRFFMKKYGWRVEEVKGTAVKETPKTNPKIEQAILEETPAVEEFAEVPEPEFIGDAEVAKPTPPRQTKTNTSKKENN